MSHNIRHYTYPGNVNRKKVKEEIDHFVSMEDWQEGCSGLYHPIRWIETEICPDYDSAMRKLESLDRGDYDNLAIRYYDCLPFTDSKVKELEEKREIAYALCRRVSGIVYPKTIKAAYITCKVCGSKLSRVRLTGNNCPLCKNSLCPDSFKEKLNAAKNRYEKACQNLNAYRNKKAKKEIRWLVKLEYHT